MCELLELAGYERATLKTDVKPYSGLKWLMLTKHPSCSTVTETRISPGDDTISHHQNHIQKPQQYVA